ncbi:MAG TPA: helix-turn-helix domain-containing protein [Chloroflexia bacterium]|nr:helix-turn-helix domain-containing protein [Chloroflexia bacterium]
MTDEMYTTKQAALYLGVTEADIRLAVRENKLRAWNLPLQKGLLVRKGDLMRFREPGGRTTLTRQLPLFSADARQPQDKSDANVA